MIGSHVVEGFLAEGHDVTVLDNLIIGKKEFVPSQANFWQKDIRDQDLDLREFDGIIHLAAEPFIPESYVRPWEFFDVNVFGTLNLFLRAKSAGVKKIILYSTSEVYGNALTRPMDEQHATLPTSTYGVSKLAADRLSWSLWHEQKIPIVIQRQFNVYGPRCMQPYVIPTIIKQMLSAREGKKTVVQLGRMTAARDFTFVTDAVSATLLLYKHGIPGEVYNVGSGVPRKISSIAEDIARIFGKEISIQQDPIRLRPIDIDHLEADASKIRAMGWKPQVSWEEGLRQTIKWYQNNRHHYSELASS